MASSINQFSIHLMSVWPATGDRRVPVSRPGRSSRPADTRNSSSRSRSRGNTKTRLNGPRCGSMKTKGFRPRPNNATTLPSSTASASRWAHGGDCRIRVNSRRHPKQPACCNIGSTNARRTTLPPCPTSDADSQNQTNSTHADRQYTACVRPLPRQPARGPLQSNPPSRPCARSTLNRRVSR